MSTRLRIAGLAVDGKYAFLRGAIRPYLASGVGLYRLGERFGWNYLCTETAPGAGLECVPGEERSFGDVSPRFGF